MHAEEHVKIAHICSRCGKEMGSKVALKKHEATEHNINASNKCDICNRSVLLKK